MEARGGWILFRLFLVCLLVFAVAGCATKYVVPSGTGTALVRFQAEGLGPNNNAHFYLVTPGPDCKKHGVQQLAKLGAEWGNKRLSDVRMIGSTGQPDRLRYEREVEAGQSLRLVASWIPAFNPYELHYNVLYAGLVELEAGKQYEVGFDLRADRRGIRVQELSETNGEISRRDQLVRPVRVRKASDLCDL